MSELQHIFECTRCGYCCHGEVTVSLDEHDQKIMLKGLACSREEAAEKYWRITDQYIQMKTVDGHCVFYKDGCQVHSCRPWRCRQWPFHPSILIDEANFQSIKQSCPGINQTISYEKFCEIMKKYINEKGIVQC